MAKEEFNNDKIYQTIKSKKLKFREYYDDDFSEEDQYEVQKRKKKLGKLPRRKSEPSDNNSWE